MTTSKTKQMYRDLAAAVRECSVPNWDGEGADPISKEVVERASEFIDSLPPEFPLPEIDFDPDGMAAFEWFEDHSNLLSISLDASGMVYMVAVSQGNKRLIKTATFNWFVLKEMMPGFLFVADNENTKA